MPAEAWEQSSPQSHASVTYVACYLDAGAIASSLILFMSYTRSTIMAATKWTLQLARTHIATHTRNNIVRWKTGINYCSIYAVNTGPS